LLRPRSIAVIGASTQPEKVGGMPIRLLGELGYAGRVFPVNPGADTVQGLRAFPTVEAIGEPVDLAIVAVPAPAAPDVMAQLGRAGTRAAVVFTSGFAEVANGSGLQHALATQAKTHGVQLLGPNCLGDEPRRAHVRHVLADSADRRAASWRRGACQPERCVRCLRIRAGA
jgi:acyl-CoA synthetase (NDP forming)